MAKVTKLDPTKRLALAKVAELKGRQETLQRKLVDAIPHFEATLPPQTPVVIVTGVRGAGVSFAANIPRDEARMMLRELLDHLEGRRMRGGGGR